MQGAKPYDIDKRKVYEDSYGYRPNRSAHDAVAKVQERCWQYAWVLDMDISKFFDTIDHFHQENKNMHTFM